jgi:hypothetical protein
MKPLKKPWTLVRAGKTKKKPLPYAVDIASIWRWVLACIFAACYTDRSLSQVYISPGHLTLGVDMGSGVFHTI